MRIVNDRKLREEEEEEKGRALDREVVVTLYGQSQTVKSIDKEK
jgi:hypothetical protein